MKWEEGCVGDVSKAEILWWYGADHYRPQNHTAAQRSNVPASRLINVYMSSDLYTWAYRGVAFEMHCATGSCYVDRPKVFFDRQRDRFVMWLKSTPYLAVATASQPAGPFELRSRWSPNSSEAVGDISTFVDPPTGVGYLIYSALPKIPILSGGTRRVLRLSQMTADFLNLSGDGRIAIAKPREAPVLFMHSKRYYLWTSRATGWKANPSELFSAASLEGEWISEGNPTGSSTSFDSQPTAVLQLTQGRATELVYLGDRFEAHVSGPLCNRSPIGWQLCESGRYVWLPMSFNQNTANGSGGEFRLSVSWKDSWKLGNLFTNTARGSLHSKSLEFS